eukprot:3646389-Prymnesium_polylepis.2
MAAGSERPHLVAHGRARVPADLARTALSTQALSVSAAVRAHESGHNAQTHISASTPLRD